MNLILEKSEQVKFYTNMEDVLTALGNICCEFDWYISDIEVNKGNIEEGWYSGVELEKILNAQKIYSSSGPFLVRYQLVLGGVLRTFLS